ncbi:cell envelope integrity TolA C-terminal domain-containing protein [Klebsiella oxytoca]|uniref:TolA family protein n=1 Tax=Klebsiella oxytoca TaxID=571 RepID=A0A6B8N3H3_KLEOX|nr:cell envelope integrity TolA C-terminal domain-containing protein [Klebsiella oxytoca]QGN39161.1 tolA family protein [Klebsiella oxytoca]
MKKILMMAIVVIFTSSCAPLRPSDCHKTTALGSCDSGRFNDDDAYGKQARAIKESIESRLSNRYGWKGKKCRIHLRFDYDGKLQSITTSEGNKQYCDALVEVAKQATFAPFTDKKIYNAFAQSRFNMQGE